MKANAKRTSGFVLGVVRTGNILEKILDFIGGIAISVFVGAIFLDVAARTAGSTLKSCQEIALFAFVWAIFTGSAIAVRDNSHFAIDIVIGAFKGIPKKIIEIVGRMAVSIFAVVRLVYGWQYAVICLKRFSQPSGICMTVGTSCIVFGAVCMIFYCIEYFILSFSGTDLRTCKEKLSEAKK